MGFKLIYIPLFTYEYVASACRPPVIGPLTGNKVGNKSVPTLRWSGEGRMDEYVMMGALIRKGSLRRSSEALKTRWLSMPLL